MILMPLTSLLTITAITTAIFRLLSSDLSPIQVLMNRKLKKDELTRDIFKVSDPYNSIELTCCSLIFGKQEVDENRNMKQKKKD